MLVLTRKENQPIQIGENITIKITRIRGNTARVVIDAPKDVKVLRGEIADRNQPPGKAA